MKNRKPSSVTLLFIFTLGFYYFYWLYVTSNEMDSLGASVPNALLIFVPFVNWWWLWKYGKGVEQVTNNQMSVALAILLVIISPFIGVIQSEFNNVNVVNTNTSVLPIQ